MPEGRVALPIPYTADEVSRTFTALLATFDFAMELRELNIGTLSLFKRQQARQQFTALCIALWHVALEKSFPNDAETFFAHFTATWPRLQGEGKRARTMRGLLAEHDALVGEKKDADFSRVAEKIVDLFNIPAVDRPKLQLKLSLRIRSIYELIFTKLIWEQKA